MWKQNSYSYYVWLALVQKTKKIEAMFDTLNGNYVRNRNSYY